jgi:hypothetical protein
LHAWTIVIGVIGVAGIVAAVLVAVLGKTLITLSRRHVSPVSW